MALLLWRAGLDPSRVMPQRPRADRDQFAEAIFLLPKIVQPEQAELYRRWCVLIASRWPEHDFNAIVVSIIVAALIVAIRTGTPTPLQE